MTTPKSQKIVQKDSPKSSSSNVNEISSPKMRKATSTPSKKSGESISSGKRVVSNTSPIDAQRAAQTAHASRPASAWPTSSSAEKPSAVVDTSKTPKGSGEL